MTVAQGSAPNGPIRIVLVDNHALVREGLRAMLEVLPNCEVVGEAGTGAQALQWAAAWSPDLMLLDAGLRDMSGIQVVSELQRTSPAVRVLMLSAHDNREYVVGAIRAGASGYVSKEASFAEVIHAIKAVVDGGTYFCPAVAKVLRGALEETDSLTSRERDVLIRLAHGESNKAVARALEIGVRTVETHRLNLRRKLGIDSPTSFLKYAVRAGWVVL